MTTNNPSAGTQIPHDQAVNKTIFTDLDSAKQYLVHIKSEGLQWDYIGLFSDAMGHNLLALLFNDNALINVFRFSFQGNRNEQLISYLSESYTLKIIFKASIKEDFNLEEIQSLERMSLLWKDETISSKKMKFNEITKLFERWNLGREKVTGRGNKFTQNTKRLVMEDSHGRCMFSGCGTRLDFDSLTGHRGNFGYMAHNIAASESGPRGVFYLSANLSDDPSNVLLLCDVHHRLVDRVANLDYPAQILEKMRENHIILSNKLLESLSYAPVPIYFIPWGVNGQDIEKPNDISIANSLSVVRHRAKQDLTTLDFGVPDSRNSIQEFHRRCSEHIGNSVSQIKSWANGSSAAVFALGPTFALIGFGAKFGNKSKLMPMLRYRDASSWMWPGVQPREDAFIIDEPKIDPEQSEVIVSVKLTADAEMIDATIDHLYQQAQNKLPVINIYPPQSYGYGNGAIAHPLEGEKLANRLKEIFTNLNQMHGIKKVHLLVCASNAACVYIGQAVDRFQPEFIVYDYGTGMMEPKLRIYNDGKTTVIECVP
ncbi:SAVED domain-containing protein [Psychrobacter sp. NPDC078929]|uniref:SAVED domain-containing protein n=1 Tax=unclassified Psychrobacter TaxID=196806 RepID=UPI003CFFDABF